jgi:hypothetical protein
MTLRRSESLLRLLVGLALGFGFLGFATHSRAEAPSLVRLQTEAELQRPKLPDWVPDPMVDAAARLGIPHAGVGAALPMTWREGQGAIAVLRPGIRYARGAALLSIGGSF